MRILHVWVLLVLILAAWPAPALAEPEEEPPPTDVRDPLFDVQDSLKGYAEEPDKHEARGAIHRVWRSRVKSRVKRMRNRIKEMLADKRWFFTEDGALALMLMADSWSTFVRHAAGLHTELGGIPAGYDSIDMSPDAALRAWDRAHPEPSLYGPTASEHKLKQLQAKIKIKIVNGKVKVSAHWQLQINYLKQQIEIERAARIERHRIWKEERALARAEILARIHDAKEEIEAARLAVLDDMRTLRTGVAAAQQAEEERLAERVAAFPEVEDLQALAKKALAEMAKGRMKALRFNEDKLSKYGSMLRGDWMRHRSKLILRIKRAHRDAEKAAAAAAREAEEKDAESEAPEESGK